MAIKKKASVKRKVGVKRKAAVKRKAVAKKKGARKASLSPAAVANKAPINKEHEVALKELARAVAAAEKKDAAVPGPA